MKHFTLLFCLLSVTPAFATDSLEVIRDQAAVYSAPNPNAQPLTQLPRGRSLQSDGRRENGLIHLTTKSGRSLWIKEKDVRVSSVESDLAHPEESQPRQTFRGFPQFTYDLGGSSGNYNGESYSEINLGLNTFFRDWLDWRNAVFYRFGSAAANVYGLDSSLRGILTLGGRDLGVTLFGGPGMRFISRGVDAPFLEAGIVAKLTGLSIGIGAKSIHNTVMDSSAADETQVFIILAGGGSL